MKLTNFSAAALSALIALGAAQAGAASYNYVQNGSFEDDSSPLKGKNGKAQAELGGTAKESYDVFKVLPGWTAGSVGGGIEVQTAGTISTAFGPHSGRYHVELDSIEANGISNSSMSQELTLGQGTYELSFWYSPRKSNAGTNGISYQVTDSGSNSLLFDTITGPDAANDTSVGTWTMFSAIFRVAQGASPVTLMFSATGNDDELGGFLDDISVTAVPVPAALPVLITGLAGLGFLSRRKTAA